MSMEFMFAMVPFQNDGHLKDLFKEKSNDDALIDGALFLETVGEECIPKPTGLALGIWNKEILNEETEGAFSDVIGSGGNQSYVLLAPRREALDRLRAAITRFDTESFWRNFLEVFVRNADAALEKYGDRAALIVF